MNAGEIGTEAGRIFEYNLPSNWIFRSQEDQNDFGIDGEIERKDDSGRALGKDTVFKVQIKGEEHSSFIHDNNILSFTLKTERLRYYFEFKVPVILVIVEVTSEKIFWLPITNNEILREKTSKSNQNETVQVHIPIENTLVRKNISSANKILDAVMDCWDYLNVKGLKDSVARYPIISPSSLDKKIEDIGETLYKAYHQQLDNLLAEKKYDAVFERSTEISNSPIVPAKDRFVAVLYYWQAFQISPYTNIKREVYRENFYICQHLMLLAREQKSRVHRLIALSKSRGAKFKAQLEQLHATHHSVNHFEEKSLEHYIFNDQTQIMYRDCCTSLQKIIELCNRMIRNEQYHILSDFFVNIYASVLIFKQVHEARGSKETIEFLDDWYEKMSLLVMAYCIISKNLDKIERIYFLTATLLKQNPNATRPHREMILSTFPDFDKALTEIECHVISLDNKKDFYDLTVEEQKEYFLSMAKNLGMDPDDTQGEYHEFLRIGFANYDPTNIMKNCEHLFVHYRPGGILAQSLRMHSLGGMHLLFCLKHKYVQGTGNLLSQLYDSTGDYDFGNSFKQSNCDKCMDCKPRPDSWSWDLKWYLGEAERNKEILEIYKF
ncbi:TPA: DUF4365 domain-containing protein [Providencia stuartii]|uniref:DUF4365 domain-containing protein n=1 Tax=Providencia stuartii TaxID=588 RepID=UPI000977D7E5|nr:DUF4365 domain-containing protein [Providencia stuartii]OMH53376.1 hypothetical protein BTZ17_04525 [Providencia stuartii]HEM8866581.1 DUF4365 domain-containing protein [Providencia stuartii]